MSNRVNLFKERADRAAAKARQVAEKAAAENRPMTADERTVYEDSMAELSACLDGVKAARADDTFIAAARAEFAGIGGTAKDTSRRLTFKGMAAGIANRMLTGGEFGAKALAPSGATVVPQAFTPDPVALGRPATGLLDVLGVQVQASQEYSFLRQGGQGTRTNLADVVADGETKPTSVIGLERVEQSLQVVAHLSEGIPRYWLVDNDQLETFVGTELDYGLRVAVEAKVISDINATSGIQEQDFSTSIVQTIRKALTKIEVAGYTPGAIVLHPEDFEAVELAISSTNAIEYTGLPYDAAQRRLFGVPIATTVSQDVGVAHVVAAGAVVLDTDAQGVGVQWSETSNAEDFARNLVRARCEGRFGTSVLSPLGVVLATLADDGS